MASIHHIRVVPRTLTESQFKNLLKDIGVKKELLMCRKSHDFNTKYDEYIISHGLYKIIISDLSNIKGISFE